MKVSLKKHKLMEREREHKLMEREREHKLMEREREREGRQTVVQNKKASEPRREC